MTFNRPTSFVCMLILLCGLAACSKNENKDNNSAQTNEVPSLADATSSKGIQQAKVNALPQGNQSTPLSQYRKLENENDVMFTFYALSSLPIDYDKLLKTYSQDYQFSTDEFKKQDMQKALKPKIDQQIANAKSSNYIKVIWGQFSLDKYDFQEKGFPQHKLTKEVNFGWGYDYRIEFTNGEDFKLLKVADEAKARIIEEKRSKGENLDLIIYAFAQDSSLDNHHVKAQILKVVLVDKNGAELL